MSEMIDEGMSDFDDPIVQIRGTDTEVANAPPFTYDEDEPNLVDTFSEHPEGVIALKKLSEKVTQDFDAAWEATEEYRERMAQDWTLFSGDLPEKTFPFEDAANTHVPIVLENISRLSFRMEAELFGNFSEVVKFQSLGPADNQVAPLLTLHTNWQFRVQIPDFKRQMSRGVLAFCFIGDVTGHSYYDEFRKQNRHEILTPDEFVVPYTYTSTMPDYSDCPYRVKILSKYRHEIEAMRDSWSGIDKMLDGEEPTWDDEPERRISDVAARSQGVDKPEGAAKGGAPYTVLQYEGWAMLPNQTRQRFVQVFVDKASRAVLKLCIYEEANWQDKLEFERKSAELASYRGAQDLHGQAMAQHEQALGAHAQRLGEVNDHLAAGRVGPLQASMMTQDIQGQAPQPPEPPPPPAWAHPDDLSQPDFEVSPPEKLPIHLFSHAVCIESLVGNLGLSYGRMQADHNRAANTVLSQFIDAATLSNCKSIITAGNVEFADKFKIAPGAINKIPGVSPGELQNSIMPFAFGDANPALLEVLKTVKDFAESSIQAPSVLSGESGKSGETFRGISARIEQATKQISVGAGKYGDFLLQLARNNSYLNSIFLRDSELIGIEQNLLPQGVEELKVSRSMYERSYQIELRADLRFATQAQKISEADDIIAFIEKVPQLQGDQALLYEAVKGSLIARGRRDMVPMLGPPPPAPQTTFGFVPPPPPPPPPPANIIEIQGNNLTPPAQPSPMGGGPGAPGPNVPGGHPPAPPMPPANGIPGPKPAPSN